MQPESTKWIVTSFLIVNLIVSSSHCHSQQNSTQASIPVNTQANPVNNQANPKSSLIEIMPTKIKRIEPGTVIGNSAPKGWTYLLFKNQSSIGAGDMDAASDMLKDLASLFSSVMVANVVPNESQTKYIFADIAYGLYTKIGDKNVVISGATYKKLGASLNFIQSSGLSAAEARLEKLSITARTESLVIVDAKSMVLLNGKHHETMVRHAVLLNQSTGRLVTLVWFYDPEEGRKGGRILSQMDCIAPNSQVDVILHLDKSEFTLGLPTEKALALNKMVWGPTQVPLPKELESLGRLTNFTESALLQFEAGLRQVVSP